jgi:hypothetical protein
VFEQVVADQQTVCFQALNRAAQINRIPKNDRGHYERETTGPITTNAARSAGVRMRRWGMEMLLGNEGF